MDWGEQWRESVLRFSASPRRLCVLSLRHRHGLGGMVGRGRGGGVGLPGGGVGVTHCGTHIDPLLYWVSVRSKPVGLRDPLPTGGMTRDPIAASACATVCSMHLPSAPLAMLSFAAIS